MHLFIPGHWHVHNTNWIQQHTTITCQQPRFGASHQMLWYEPMWSNLDDGPDLSTNVTISVHLRCKKITHGAQHLLTCCTAYTTSSHLAPCAISGTKAKWMACGANRAAATSTFCVKHLQSFIEFAEDTYTNKFVCKWIGRYERHSLSDKLLTTCDIYDTCCTSWWWEVRRAGEHHRI